MSGGYNDVVRRCPCDLEEVVFGIGEVAGAAGEELGVLGRLGDASAGQPHTLREIVDQVLVVDKNLDGGADASSALLGVGASVTRQALDREQSQHTGPELEQLELLVDDQRPTERDVEVTQAV